MGVDIRSSGETDLVCDLNGPWPWEESTVDEIFAQDCFEHLYPLGKVEGQANITEVLKRAWTVLKPGGILEILVPSTEGRGAWQDPTHVTWWNLNTLRYFIPGFPHFNIYSGFGIKFSIEDEDGLLWAKMTATEPTGVSWVHARMQAVKD